MSALDYARQQFTLAVDNMAVGAERLEKRIFSAWWTIHTVKAEAFQSDDDLRFAWNDLQQMLKSAEAGTNSLERGLDKIEEEEVRRLAEQIVLVAGRLRNHQA